MSMRDEFVWELDVERQEILRERKIDDTCNDRVISENVFFNKEPRIHLTPYNKIN